MSRFVEVNHCHCPACRDGKRPDSWKFYGGELGFSSEVDGNLLTSSRLLVIYVVGLLDVITNLCHHLVQFSSAAQSCPTL